MCALPANHDNGAARDVTFMVTKARQLPVLVDISCSPDNGCAIGFDLQMTPFVAIAVQQCVGSGRQPLPEKPDPVFATLADQVPS
jgi:hypothetical protein